MNIKEIRETLDNTKVYINGKGIELRAKLESFGYCMREKMSYSILPFWYIAKSGHIGGGSNMEDFRNRNCREVSVDDILNIEIDKSYCQFKPFDKVLVRWREDLPWSAGIFSHEDKNKNQINLIGGLFTFERNNVEIIPYNSKTAHLIGTYKDYKDEAI